MKRLGKLMFLGMAACAFSLSSCSNASNQSYDVPTVLPRPDNTKKPTDGKVKVYIMAGQSNMVGFGQYKDAKPVYPSIYMSADPSIKIGRMPIGDNALLKHGVYQSSRKRADKGAKVSIYSGAYKEGTDYSKQKAVKETTVALGTVSENLPSVSGAHTTVAEAYIDVPMSGTYEIHVGYENSTYAVARMDGKEVYRKNIGDTVKLQTVELEEGKRYPLNITYMKDGSAALWLKCINLPGKGDLMSVINQGRYPCFVDDKGEWTVRNDVTYREVRITKDSLGAGGPLSTNSNGGHIGCEVPFGYVMGEYHDEPVLLIESSMGNRALTFDFLPPSSPRTPEMKGNQWVGLEYDLMVKGVHMTLDNIEKFIPNYKGQGYEIAGFVWWQGHKDKGVPTEKYERDLVNLINDVKKEFNAPDMKTVVATVGFDGYNMQEGHKLTWQAQMNVGDPQKHPEFKGQVATVDMRPFFRPRGESPTSVDYHYNFNAETYLLTGDAIGRAMIKLLGGNPAPMDIPERVKRHPMVEQIYADSVTRNFQKVGYHYPVEYFASMRTALKPIVVDDMIPEYVAKTRYLKDMAAGKKPDRLQLDIRGEFDALLDYYRIAGISDYDWHEFGPKDMRHAEWNYFSFDPKEKQPIDKSNRYRKITFPAGMSKWYAKDFNPKRAGWKVGKAPFGQCNGKLAAPRGRCYKPSYCGCDQKPNTLWEKEVLLMNQTFEIPAFKKGYIYRIIMGGSGCDRTGEGFAIYVNGKLLTQQNGGLFKNSGVRGAIIYSDMFPEFQGGKVTISVINFLRYTFFNSKRTYWPFAKEQNVTEVPPHGLVTLFMQEAKIPPVL